MPSTIYFSGLFSIGKWKKETEFILTGKRKEVEIIVSIEDCNVEYKNLTSYETPPYFESMKADETGAKWKNAYENWLNSLPENVRKEYIAQTLDRR